MNQLSIERFSKYLAATFTLLLLSGGACYQKHETISSKGLTATQLLPSYSIEENNSDNQSKCSMDVRQNGVTLDRQHGIELIPPTSITFQGKPLVLNKLVKFPCQRPIGEFVIVDDRGGKRTDKFDLRRLKFALAKIPAMRSQDLRIKIVEAPYPENTNLSITFDLDGPNLETVKVRNVVDSSNLLPMFNRSAQTVIIPAQILQRLKGKAIKIRLRAEVELDTKYPNDSSFFQSFGHIYHNHPATIEFQ